MPKLYLCYSYLALLTKDKKVRFRIYFLKFSQTLCKFSRKGLMFVLNKAIFDKQYQLFYLIAQTSPDCVFALQLTSPRVQARLQL